MEANKLQELIIKCFDKISKGKRQIVFWYDNGGQNESALNGLDLPNIKIHKLTKTNNLLTKKLLEHDDLTSNYLVYAQFEKPEPINDWFLDTHFYSKEFSVDEVANLCSEFDIYDAEIKTLFKNHLKFFNNRERVSKFKRLLPSNKTAESIYIAMLATLVNGKLPDINKVVQRAIIKSLIEKEDISSEFAKYNLEDIFWNLTKRQFGYDAEKDYTSLLVSIIFRKLKQQLRGNTFPTCYKKYTCDNTKEVECSLFLENWYRDSELMPYYKTIVNGIEKDFDVAKNLTDLTDIIEQEPDFQTLEVFDTFLINYSINAFETLKCEHKKILEKRKNTLFYDNHKAVYETLYWAIELNNLVKMHNIPDQKPQDFIKNYASDYYKIDKAYRKFYYYYKKSNSRALDKVKEGVEKAYVNNYLDTLSSKFSTQINGLAPVWKIADIPMQKELFY